MDFTKMQGIGNDYVYVDCFKEQVKEPGAVARFISDRRFGIGSDGLILICPSRIADCRMEMYNTDGSQGKMCGNGIRCVGKYVYDHGLVPSDRRSLTVETLAGVKELRLEVEEGKAVRLTVDMGKPSLTSEISESVTIEGKEWNFTGIDVGNPHAVYFVEDTDSLDLEKMGPHFEYHERFMPDRVNSEFIRVIDRNHIQNACVGAGQRRDLGLRHRGCGQRHGIYFKRLYGGRGDGIPAGRRFEDPPGSGERPSVYDRTGCRSISRKY